MMQAESLYKSPARGRLSYVPWLPILLGLVAIICTGIWHHYSSLALLDTKIIAALISLPAPKAFSTVIPALLAASVALVVILTIAVWALYAWRALQQFTAVSSKPASQRFKPFVIVAGITNGLLYILLVWYCVMFAISLLWLGGGMIASKATKDGADTLYVVDDTMPNLIRAASNNTIDPANGYLVTVAGRDVDIGQSSCSLFCFTLARAMLADTIDCTCNTQLAQQMLPATHVTHDITDPDVCTRTPVMCSINARAFALFKDHMMPALVCIIIALLSIAGLLMLVSGTFARALHDMQPADISRCSSADVQMQIDGNETTTPRKGDLV